MKRRLLKFALAALTIGLLGSCSKINGRFDSLEKRMDSLESNEIATIKDQIASINTSIADLVTIRSNVQDLISKTQAQGGDITGLKAADVSLGQRIDELKSYIDGDLTGYAKIDWVKATFATLEQHEWTCDTIAGIDARIGALDTKLSQSISGLEGSLKQWVNEQLDAYYTAAQMDAKIGALLAQIQSTGSSANARIDSLAAELTATKSSVDTAKANIRSEYRNAIASAIATSEGKLTQALKDSITAVNGKITALTGRVETLESTVAALSGDVDALKAMIQSVSITPAYSDGSVEALDGILTLKCIVKPAEALVGMVSLKDSLLIYADSVKVKTKATSAYMEIKVSEASVLDAAQGAIILKADISEYLPKGEDQVLTVALNLKNGISDFTTDFVPVYVAAAPGPVLPAGALAGKFSVAEGKKVHFSKGNLVATIDATGAPTAWKFAANQYDCLGEGGANKAIGKLAGDIDLFGWSTSATKYGISQSQAAADYSGDFVDWGTAIDSKGTWRTLSADEWTYLFNTRTASTVNGIANARYARGAVNNNKGIILLPDTYVHPEGVAALNGINAKAPEGGFTSNTYDSVNWAKMEEAGAVFIPAAGNRSGYSVSDVGGRALYWSSTASGSDNACDLYFLSGNFFTNMANNRYLGSSVRLVTEPGAPAPQVISVENVSLNKNTLELAVGSDETLTATVTPDNATDKSVSWSSSDESVATVDASGKVTAVAAGTATITVTTTDGGKTAPCVVTVIPAGALTGEFTVAEGKKVRFSQGNLVATIDAKGAPTAWKFATNQYDYLGNGGANKKIGSKAGDVDLFGWSTASTTYGISKSTTSGDYSGDFVDWGKNMGDGNTWRTLSKGEWVYLFNSRTNASSLYKYGVTVCGKNNCLIIAPDNWDTSANPLQASYDATAWATAEAAGLVCLPAAGNRNGSDVSSVGSSGPYWSSTAYDSGRAIRVLFDSAGVLPGFSDSRYYGFSVRLITESK